MESYISYVGVARNSWIIGENKQRYLWIINSLDALLNIALNLVVIPVSGISAAAFASLVTQIFVNVIVGYIIRPISQNNQLLLRGMNPKVIVEFLESTS